MENKNFSINQKNKQRTKKQHYIRQKYLKNWTDENNKLYVLRKILKGKQKNIEYRETTKVGFENNFYDISEFSEKDIQICEDIINYLQKDEQFKLIIREFFLSDNAKNQKDFLEKEAICYYEEIDDKYKFIENLAKEDFSFYENNIRQKKFDELLINLILFPINISNDIFSEKQITEKINNFLIDDTPDLKHEFNKFFFMQYYRTPKFRSILQSYIKENEHMQSLNINFCINRLVMYFTERMATNINSNYNTTILLSKNETNIPFITCDSPIYREPTQNNNFPATFYFPINPKIAIHLIVTQKFGIISEIIRNIAISIDDETIVKNFNKKLVDNCVNEIYANNKQILEELI